MFIYLIIDFIINSNIKHMAFNMFLESDKKNKVIVIITLTYTHIKIFNIQHLHPSQGQQPHC